MAVEGETRLKVFSFRPDTGEHEELPAIEAKVDNPNFIFSHDDRYVAWQCGRPNTGRDRRSIVGRYRGTGGQERKRNKRTHPHGNLGIESPVSVSENCGCV